MNDRRYRLNDADEFFARVRTQANALADDLDPNRARNDELVKAIDRVAKAAWDGELLVRFLRDESAS